MTFTLTPQPTSSQTASAIQQLQACLVGDVWLPGDADYETNRWGFNLNLDQHPVAIAHVATVDDVIATLHIARQHNLPVALKATGHGAVKPCNGVILLVTDAMQGVQIDPEARTARFAAGVRWADVLSAAQAYGLAPLVGSTTRVGAVGYSLGGGIGWLTRKYGLAVDSIRSFEMVTADGQFRQVDATHHPDLFWGVRGGTSNFGVVTAMEIELYPVTQVYAGNLYYPIELAPTVMTAYREWIHTLPEEFTTGILLMHIPPLPVFPPQLQGRSVCVIRGCYHGAMADGERWLQPMRSLGNIVLDAFGAIAFQDADTISNDPPDAFSHFTHTESLRNLDPATIQALIDVAGAPPTSPIFALEIRHMGGAMTRVPPDSNAFSHRDSEFVLLLYGMVFSPEHELQVTRYLNAATTVLAPHCTGKVYHNFLLDTDYTPAKGIAVRSDENRTRLSELKRRYDPANLFRFNVNVLPAEE